MPVVINNLKEKGYFKIRIALANAFNAEEADEAGFAEQWAEAYVEVRELDATEAAQANESPESVMENLANFIVDHNFHQDEEGKKKASKEQVAEVIKRSSTVYNYVLNEWLQHLPLVKRSAANSAKSPKT